MTYPLMKLIISNLQGYGTQTFIHATWTRAGNLLRWHHARGGRPGIAPHRKKKASLSRWHSQSHHGVSIISNFLCIYKTKYSNKLASLILKRGSIVGNIQTVVICILLVIEDIFRVRQQNPTKHTDIDFERVAADCAHLGKGLDSVQYCRRIYHRFMETSPRLPTKNTKLSGRLLLLHYNFECERILIALLRLWISRFTLEI